jgi:xylose isomerase
MRTYLALAEKARRFNSDPQIQEALAFALAPQLGESTVGSYTAEAAEQLKEERPDLEALAARNYGNERLDQLVIDLILGL